VKWDDRVLDMATCKRSRHHAMFTDSTYRLRQGAYRHRLVWRCARCGTVRHDLLDWAGNVMRRQYDYPEGYAELEATAMGELRLALVARERRRHDEAASAEVVPIRARRAQ